jgi:hypothetical protein
VKLTRLWITLAPIASVLSMLLAPSSVANAGTYVVYTCPSTAPQGITAQGWSVAAETTDPYSFASLQCNSDHLTNAADPSHTHPRGSSIGLRWTAAAGTRVLAYSFDQEVYAPGDFAANWMWEYTTGIVDAATTMAIPVRTCFDPATSCQTQSGIRDFADLNNHKATAVWIRVVCSERLTASCAAGYQAHVAIRSAKFTIEDSAAPRFTSPPTGELLDSSHIVSGNADVRFSAADFGSGISKAMIEVDGAVAASFVVDDNDGRCRQPYTDPAPCSPSAHSVLQFDTRVLPDGPHTVRLFVTDATERNTAMYGPVEILAVNGVQPVPSRLQSISCPLATDAVTLKLRRRSVRFGRRAIVRGRVRADRPESIVALVGDGDGTVAKLVAPDADGTFRVAIRPGQSQTVRAILLAPGEMPQCGRQVRVAVRAAVTLAASRSRMRNGGVLRLAGTVKGAIPQAGKRLVLRVRGAGSTRWYRADTIRTDMSGAWNWQYRFRRTHQRTTYIFQAVAPRQSGFPYALGRSRAVRVEVVP